MKGTGEVLLTVSESIERFASALVPSAFMALRMPVSFAGTVAATGQAVVAKTCTAAAGARASAGMGAGTGLADVNA